MVVFGVLSSFHPNTPGDITYVPPLAAVEITSAITPLPGSGSFPSALPPLPILSEVLEAWFVYKTIQQGKLTVTFKR